MPYPTFPAYSSTAAPGEKLSREHPVLDFLVDHQEGFNAGNIQKEPWSKWHADKFTFTKPDGTVCPPGEASFTAWMDLYKPFAKREVHPQYAVVYQKDGAWEMLGYADMFADLVVPGEKKVTDPSGEKWDVLMPGAFRFVVVEDGEGVKGYKIKSMRVYGDGSGVVAAMVTRGMIKPQDLAG